MPAKDNSNAGNKPLRISQVAEAAGVSKQTIEYYLMLGLVEVERTPKTNRRIFTPEHVKRVKLIRQLNRSGYTLREIRETWLKKKR